MKKTWFAIVLLFVCSILFSSAAHAQDMSVGVSVNGKNVYFPDAKPFIDSAGRIQTPAKFIGEAMGAAVTWSGSERKAVFTRGKVVMELYIGKSEYSVSGTKKSMDTAAILKGGRIFVPVKYVAEAFGANAWWNGDERKVQITLPGTAESIIEGKDVEEGIIVNSRDEFVRTLKAASYTLQPSVVISTAKYSYEVFDLNNINIYGVNRLRSKTLIENGKIKITVDLGYTQEYKISQSLKNSLAESRMTPEDRDVLDKVNSIIGQIIKDGMTDYEKELKIHDYMVLSSKFDYDNLIANTVPPESFTPYGLLINGAGVCQAYADSAKLLLNAAGIECEVITGTADGSSHAWNIVKLDGQYYMLDVTWDDVIPDRKGKVSYSYFNLTSNRLAKDHVWDKSKWPDANGTRYNYFVYNDLIADNYNDFKQLVKDQIDEGKKDILIYLGNYNKEEYGLDFIFDYYNGSVDYTEPEGNNSVIEIRLT
jgi:hypothetical protein